MNPTLSILICTLPNRSEFLDLLLTEVTNQMGWRPGEFTVKFNSDPVISIGEKRNILLQNAPGDYVCFVDDDDMISEDYLETIYVILRANKNPPDCFSLRGIMTTDGQNPEVFEHSLKYSEWKDNGAAYPNVRYERYPNHLNVIRADIAKQFKFPETNHGEDFQWSKQLHESRLLKNEVLIDKPLYYYRYRTNKK